jgi:hypothetical protein
MRPQEAAALVRRGQGHQPNTLGQGLRHTQSDVATAHDEHALAAKARWQRAERELV